MFGNMIETRSQLGQDEGEVARVHAAESTGLLGSAADERFDRIVRVAREVLGMPDAEINVLDASRQFTKAPQPPEGSTFTLRSDSLCDVTIQQRGVQIIPDGRADPRFSGRGAITGERHIRFYAGVPLVLPPDVAVGTLCVYASEPREFGESDQQLLKQLAIWAGRELSQSVGREVVQGSGRALVSAPVETPGFDVASLMIPFGDAAGDYCSTVPYSSAAGDGLALTVVDVMGKGATAAMLACSLGEAIDRFTQTLPAGEAVRRASEEAATSFKVRESFATVFHARMDASTGNVDYVDGGHGLTVVVRADGAVERLHSSDLPVGIRAEETWAPLHTRLDIGDTLISVTDGVLDLYDGSLRSLDQVAAAVRAGHSADALLDRLIAKASSNDRSDDVTAVVVTRQAATT